MLTIVVVIRLCLDLPQGSNMNTVKGLSGIKQTEEDFAADGRMVDDKNGLNRRRPIKRMSSLSYGRRDN